MELYNFTHSFLDDISHNVFQYLEDNYPLAVQRTSGVPIVNHVRNCHDMLVQCGWCDHFHWHPMMELCRLETLDEEDTWQKFVEPYDDPEHARKQREVFGLFFRRCNFLVKQDSFQCPEKFYWLAGRWQNEVWGIMMAEALAVSDELKAAGRTDEARECLRQAGPLYLVVSSFLCYDIPAEQQPTAEELKEAKAVLGLTSTEQSNIFYWDDLQDFDTHCTAGPRGAWLKRFHDLGGKDFWEIL